MPQRLFAVLLLAAALLPWPGAARADSAPPAFTAAQRAEIVAIVRDALKTDPSILRDAVMALQNDEQASKQAATQAALARLGPALVHTKGDPVGGNPDGDVTVVEFYDLRCPYCRRMLPIMADLLKRDPKIRVVYKDIPILGAPSTLAFPSPAFPSPALPLPAFARAWTAVATRRKTGSMVVTPTPYDARPSAWSDASSSAMSAGNAAVAASGMW